MFKKRILYLLSIFLFYSCGMTFIVKKDTDKEKEENNRIIASHQEIKRNKIPNNHYEYIEMYKQYAVNNMNNYHIPASITLGQGILESSGGKSNLAIDANNHFGIKCGGTWEEMTYFKDDDQKNDCFRVYTDVGKSFSDHSKILMYSRYKKLFDLDIKDYKSWAYGLKECGYATNPKYPEILIGIIEKYNLHEYDKLYIYDKQDNNVDSTNIILKKDTELALSEGLKVKTEDTIVVNQSIENLKKDIVVKKTLTNFISKKEKKKIHKVDKGDTIYNISKRYNVDIKLLKEINSLKDNSITIGQEIIIP